MNKFKIVLLLLIMVWIVFICLLDINYKNHYYQLEVNNERVTFYLNEEYTKTWIPYIIFSKTFKHEWQNQSENADSLLNYLAISKSIKVTFKDNFCYNMHNNKKVDCNSFNDSKNSPILKQNNLNNITMTIKRKNNIIYSGKYIEDITEYIKEAGRYYFKIHFSDSEYIMRTNTTLTFNIKFKGEENG